MGISEKARLGAKRYFILVPLIIFAVVAVAYFLFSRNKENPPETGNKEETLIEKQLRELDALREQAASKPLTQEEIKEQTNELDSLREKQKPLTADQIKKQLEELDRLRQSR